MKNSHKKRPFSIIKKSFIWVTSGLLLAICSIILFIINFRPSIEFTGGIQMNIENIENKDTLKENITTNLKTQGFQDIQVNIDNNETTSALLVSLPFQDDAEVKEVSKSISTLLLEKGHIQSQDAIIGSSLNGPSVSEHMKSTTSTALLLGIIFIVIYMMFSFAPMRKYISPVSLALITVATMIFDIAIPAGAYGLWMAFDSTVTVNTVFVIAILTTMGYSINDTIVIFDRIRENTIRNKDKLKENEIAYGQIFEDSLWQTMRRSIGTSVSTFLVIGAMYIFGESVMQSFAFTMGLGIIAGSYSSIFLGAPLAYLLTGRRKKEFKKMK